MDRLGVGWDALRQINPRLIYGSGTGYGLSGPDMNLLAMDHTIQAASGVMSATGDADSPPSRSGGAPCDIMGGIHIYAGVLAALQGAKNRPRHSVEVSMLGPCTSRYAPSWPSTTKPANCTTQQR